MNDLSPDDQTKVHELEHQLFVAIQQLRADQFRNWGPSSIWTSPRPEAPLYCKAVSLANQIEELLKPKPRFFVSTSVITGVPVIRDRMASDMPVVYSTVFDNTIINIVVDYLNAQHQRGEATP